MEGVCQLTGLQRLELTAESSVTPGVLLGLTQLRQLTHLRYSGPHRDNRFFCRVSLCVFGDAPQMVAPGCCHAI